MKDKEQYNYDQKIDNELKKKELTEKYGAQFSQDSKISPEMESEWLKHIEQYEDQFNKHEKIAVWQFIGKPEFKNVEEIKHYEIEQELDRITSIMNKSNVVLDTLCEVDDKELYRFITEELFLYEMDNIQVTGMTSCFIYEEFHPNAEYDIRQAFDYLLSMTMGKMDNIGGDGYDLLYIDTKNYQDANGNKLKEESVINKINNFLNSFDYFKVHLNEIISINFNEDKTSAELYFEIEYFGNYTNRKDAAVFKGNGMAKLKPSEYDGWDIYHIDLPGLVI